MIAQRSPELQWAIEQYIALFAGRTDAFSFWSGEHWTATRRPLTPEVVFRAFETGTPVSAYVLGPDSHSHVACLDIDRPDGLDLGKSLMRHIAKVNGRAYLEPSRRGCHVWMVLDARHPAVFVRRAIRGLLAGAGIADCEGKGGCPVCKLRSPEERRKRGSHPDPRIEFRPAQDRINEDDLGNCIRMPTMPHPTTKARYAMFDQHGARLPDKIVGMVSEVEYMRTTVLQEAALLAPLPPIPAPPTSLRYPRGRAPAGSASEILIDLFGALNAKPGRTVRCPLGEFHNNNDKRPSLAIARDDERAFCHSPGCPLWNDGKGRGTAELTKIGNERRP